MRTVYHPDWPWQLKFSLHVRVTNSQRVTLPKELRRAVEAARLLQTPVGERAAAIAPGLRDAAGPGLPRRAPRRRADRRPLGAAARQPLARRRRAADVSALTTLCQDHPYGGRSRLGAIVGAIAAREGRSEARRRARRGSRATATSCSSRSCGSSSTSACAWSPTRRTSCSSSTTGWPARAVYRDSQGYFHREAAHADIAAIVPGIGEASESIFPEALADERLVYYPFVNNALGVVNALGVAGVADERVLLGDLRALLERERDARPVARATRRRCWTACSTTRRGRARPTSARGCTTWTSSIGDIATQSVYVRIANPLHEAAA